MDINPNHIAKTMRYITFTLLIMIASTITAEAQMQKFTLGDYCTFLNDDGSSSVERNPFTHFYIDKEEFKSAYFITADDTKEEYELIPSTLTYYNGEQSVELIRIGATYKGKLFEGLIKNCVFVLGAQDRNEQIILRCFEASFSWQFQIR
ncbi:hypothetical protein [Gracilimonas sediminicola]|uniref:hypothetical protein n=1 Tax=Gracilimonas sediminicola TaxID=2952158 RepID=UPI0038D45756